MWGALDGKSQIQKDEPVNCKWVSLTENTIKFLEASFGHNKTLTEKENSLELMVNCRCLLNIWKQ